MVTKRESYTMLRAGPCVATAIALAFSSASFAQVSTPAAPAQVSTPGAPAQGESAVPSVTSSMADAVAELAKLADLQTKAKEYDAAIATWESVFAKVATTHDKANVWNRIANVDQMKGDYAASVHAMQQAVELWPDNGVLLTDMALLFEVENDKVNARQYYEKAIAVDPNNPLALNNLAFLLADNGGDLDQALSYAHAAMDKLPNFVEVHDTLGWIDLKKNLTTEALREFQIALSGTPNSAVYHYHFALALYQQGALEQALEHCRYALTKSPAADLALKIRNLIGNLTPQVEGLPKAPASGAKPSTP